MSTFHVKQYVSTSLLIACLKVKENRNKGINKQITDAHEIT